MKKSKKSGVVLSLFLVVAMLLSGIPASVFGEETLDINESVTASQGGATVNTEKQSLYGNNQEKTADDIADSEANSEQNAEEGKSSELREAGILDTVTIELAKFEAGENGASEKIIYLDGKSGNDSFDGISSEKAVKTFEKAKALATADMNITKITVIGTAAVEGDVSLAGTNAKLVRGDAFRDALLSVDAGKTASLSNLTIDGNSEKNANIEKSLIEVNSGATLNIGDGAVLKNNKIMDIADTSTKGGAIRAYSAVVNITGGSIEDNAGTYGGGIYLYKSELNFSGGTVQRNRSELVVDTTTNPNQYYAAGGGILAEENSTINISGDAKVLNNFSNEIGGGISLGTNQWGAGNTLNMTGGLVDGNTAGSAGGGIFVQAKYLSGGISRAYISAGRITNNIMSAEGVTEKQFGGGGIYVNGANKEYGLDGANGELYLKNALITDNEAKLQGAGVAACPISKTKIYTTNGAAIYNNKTEEIGKDIFILCQKYFGLHGGDPEYELSKRMLGGVRYDWKAPDGSLLDDSKYKGILNENGQHLSVYTDARGNELTSKLAKVIISGNKSETRGGGIGSNGSIFIGSEQKTTELSVTKKWVDENNANKMRPDKVTVKLIANNEYIVETRELSEANSWKTTFSDLPAENDGEEIVYTVEEEKVEEYTGEITGSQKDGFVITNTHKPAETEVSVSKTWKDNDNQDGIRPEKISVKLFADGKDTAKTLVLSEKTGWKAVFDKLPLKKNGVEIKYTVKEEKVEGYTGEITGDAKNGFVITNTHKPAETEVSVSKTWKDDNNKDGIRPEKISVKLFADGKDTAKTLVLSEKTAWKAVFDKLPLKKDGVEIKYTVKEEKVEGYTGEITGNAKDGFVITNTHKPKDKEVPDTGDTKNALPYILLFGGSALIILMTRFRAKVK
ncbi:MAG: Cna B-type domain-containing protein [Eubacterium sp.]|nr:Cna B-type domain-containing protein [Eubacterium sp.]